MDSKTIAGIILILVGVAAFCYVTMPDDQSDDEPGIPETKVTAVVCADNYNGLVVRFSDPLPYNTDLLVYFDGELIGDFLMKQVIIEVEYKLNTPVDIDVASQGHLEFVSEGIDYTIKFEVWDFDNTEVEEKNNMTEMKTLMSGVCEKYNSKIDREFDGYLTCFVESRTKILLIHSVNMNPSPQDLETLDALGESIETTVSEALIDVFPEPIDVVVKTDTVGEWISDIILTKFYGTTVDETTVNWNRGYVLINDSGEFGIEIPNELISMTPFIGTYDGIEVGCMFDMIAMGEGRFIDYGYIYYFNIDDLKEIGVIN